MAKTKTKKRKKRRQLSPAPVVAVLLVSLVLFLLLFDLVFRRDTEPTEPETSPSITQILPSSTLTAECFGEENGYKTYQDADTVGRLGIDVSSHQGWIDWAAVADSGVDYAIIRAGYRGYTDGALNEDETFLYNIEAAIANGLDVGVYCFSQALNAQEAAEEAAYVLELVSGYDLEYPIYFDWESIDDDSARTATISASELTACASAFCAAVEDAGYDAGVYFNLSMAVSLYHLYNLSDYDFWLAEYQDIPTYPYAIHMWQYSCEGSVPGISTKVDLNLSFQPAT